MRQQINNKTTLYTFHIHYSLPILHVLISKNLQ